MSPEISAADPSANCPRTGVFAILGEPNAGKSTLLNALAGTKIAIVTHKAQTTRAQLRGIVMEGNAQLIFIDTPGVFRPRRPLDRAMVQAAWGAIEAVDAILVMVEAHRGLTEGVRALLARLSAQADAAPLLLVINKIDRVKRPALLALTAEANEAAAFAESYMLSARTGDGVAAFRQKLAERAPEGPFLFPEDQAADIPLFRLAAEIMREKLMLHLHQELPYQLSVETERWADLKDGSARIEILIMLAREGHRAMVLGKKGQTLKRIGVAARAELEKMLERRVHLFSRIVIRPEWEHDPERYRNIGLEHQKPAGDGPD